MVNRALLVLPPEQRPKTRADCIDGPRPCPWVKCRYHLHLDGSRHRQRVIYEHDETCALDIADEGEHTFAEIGKLMSLTRGRIEQIASSAAAKLYSAAERGSLRVKLPEEHTHGKRTV